MIIYTYFSTPGIGYAFARVAEDGSFAEENVPGTVRKLFLEEGLRSLLIREGQKMIGCLRNIETEWKDENGRTCRINIAFEEDAAEDNVQHILRAATTDFEEFASRLRMAFELSDQQYWMDAEKFENLLAFCKGYEDNISLEENQFSYFAVVTGHMEEKIMENLNLSSSGNIPLSENTAKTSEMEIFVYCSSPSYGYQLKRYQPGCTVPLGTESQVVDVLGNELNSMLVVSGMKKAFFRDKKGRLCLLNKNLRSQDRKKNASFILRCGRQEQYEKLLYAMSAWGMEFPEETAHKLTDCIAVYFGERGYEFDVAKFMQTLEQMAQPKDKENREKLRKWDADIEKGKYLYAVPEVPLEYYNSCHKIKIQPDQIIRSNQKCGRKFCGSGKEERIETRKKK